MGPPEFTGGNTYAALKSTSATVSLQWGRRNSPAETEWRRQKLDLPIDLLQWGRRNSPAET